MLIKLRNVLALTALLVLTAYGAIVLHIPRGYVAALITVVWVNMVLLINGINPFVSFFRFTNSFLISAMLGTAILFITS